MWSFKHFFQDNLRFKVDNHIITFCMIWTWNWLVPSIQDLKSHLALLVIFHNFHKILLDCVRLAPISIFLHIMQRSQLKKSGVAMQLFRLGEFMVDGSSLSLKLKFWTDFPLGKNCWPRCFRPLLDACRGGGGGGVREVTGVDEALNWPSNYSWIQPLSPKWRRKKTINWGQQFPFSEPILRRFFLSQNRAIVKAFENMKSAQTGDGGCQCVHKIWGSLAHWQLQILGLTCPSKPPNLRLIQVCWRLFHADSAPFFTSHVNAYTTPCDHLSAY